jgi:hypothetical protein
MTVLPLIDRMAREPSMRLAVSYDILPYHDSPPLAGHQPPDGALDIAMTMAEQIRAYHPANDTEALNLLRASFPNAPLRLRLAALDMLRQRRTG